MSRFESRSGRRSLSSSVSSRSSLGASRSVSRTTPRESSLKSYRSTFSSTGGSSLSSLSVGSTLASRSSTSGSRFQDRTSSSISGGGMLTKSMSERRSSRESVSVTSTASTSRFTTTVDNYRLDDWKMAAMDALSPMRPVSVDPDDGRSSWRNSSLKLSGKYDSISGGTSQTLAYQHFKQEAKNMRTADAGTRRAAREARSPGGGLMSDERSFEEKEHDGLSQEDEKLKQMDDEPVSLEEMLLVRFLTEKAPRKVRKVRETIASYRVRYERALGDEWKDQMYRVYAARFRIDPRDWAKKQEIFYELSLGVQCETAITVEELQQRVGSGKITYDVRIWQEGMGNWQRVGDSVAMFDLPEEPTERLTRRLQRSASKEQESEVSMASSDPTADDAPQTSAAQKAVANAPAFTPAFIFNPDVHDVMGLFLKEHSPLFDASMLGEKLEEFEQQFTERVHGTEGFRNWHDYTYAHYEHIYKVNPKQYYLYNQPIYCERRGEASADPIKLSKLWDLLDIGELTEESRVWRTGMDDWKPLSSVKHDLPREVQEPEKQRRSERPRQTKEERVAAHDEYMQRHNAAMDIQKFHRGRLARCKLVRDRHTAHGELKAATRAIDESEKDLDSSAKNLVDEQAEMGAPSMNTEPAAVETDAKKTVEPVATSILDSVPFPDTTHEFSATTSILDSLSVEIANGSATSAGPASQSPTVQASLDAEQVSRDKTNEETAPNAPSEERARQAQLRQATMQAEREQADQAAAEQRALERHLRQEAQKLEREKEEIRRQMERLQRQQKLGGHGLERVAKSLFDAITNWEGDAICEARGKLYLSVTGVSDDVLDESWKQLVLDASAKTDNDSITKLEFVAFIVASGQGPSTAIESPTTAAEESAAHASRVSPPVTQDSDSANDSKEAAESAVPSTALPPPSERKREPVGKTPEIMPTHSKPSITLIETIRNDKLKAHGMLSRLFDAIDADGNGNVDETEGKKFLELTGSTEEVDLNWSLFLETAGTESEGALSKVDFVKYVLQGEDLDEHGHFKNKTRETEVNEQLNTMEKLAEARKAEEIAQAEQERLAREESRAARKAQRLAAQLEEDKQNIVRKLGRDQRTASMHGPDSEKRHKILQQLFDDIVKVEDGWMEEPGGRMYLSATGTSDEDIAGAWARMKEHELRAESGDRISKDAFVKYVVATNVIEQSAKSSKDEKTTVRAARSSRAALAAKPEAATATDTHTPTRDDPEKSAMQKIKARTGADDTDRAAQRKARKEAALREEERDRLMRKIKRERKMAGVTGTFNEKRIGELFDELDKDSSATLDEEEARLFLSALGIEDDQLDAHWAKLLEAADGDNDGSISREEFIGYVEAHLK